MKYEVEISETAEKSLEKIPKKDRLRIIEKIDALEQDPRPVRSLKLKGYKESMYRIRSGFTGLFTRLKRKCSLF